MRYDRQVIGYHACRNEVADRLLDGDPFRPSRNDWGWLGSGVYFWEFGHQRAHDWAQQWPRLQGKAFAVVGAILQLGNCLDLLDTDHTRRLAEVANQYLARGAEVLAQRTAARAGLYATEESQLEPLHRLRDHGVGRPRRSRFS